MIYNTHTYVFVGHLIPCHIGHNQINGRTLLLIYLQPPAAGRLSRDWPRILSSSPLEENKAHKHI